MIMADILGRARLRWGIYRTISEVLQPTSPASALRRTEPHTSKTQTGTQSTEGEKKKPTPAKLDPILLIPKMPEILGGGAAAARARHGGRKVPREMQRWTIKWPDA